MKIIENLRCEDRRCKGAQMSCGCEEIRCEDLRCEDPRHKMLQVQFFDTATVTRENKLTQKHKIFASPHGTAGYPERNLHTATCQTRMPGRHQRKIFAPPLGAAAPKPIYTQHCVDVFLALGFGALLHLCCDLPWVAKGLGWLDASCPHNATCAQVLRSPDVLQTSASTIALR